jgi:hypothetical protein
MGVYGQPVCPVEHGLNMVQCMIDTAWAGVGGNEVTKGDPCPPLLNMEGPEQLFPSLLKLCFHVITLTFRSRLVLQWSDLRRIIPHIEAVSLFKACSHENNV